MKREELIKKWLDNNLSTEEQIAFEQLEDYKDLTKLDSALKGFKAPQFSVDHNYESLLPKLNHKRSHSKPWLKPLLRMAAVLTIAVSVYFYTSNSDTQVNTLVAEQSSIALPDHSTVQLNANSTLAFNEKNWSNTREVTLQGEAFFKVAKGQKFNVITSDGIVSVLGTQFNVKQRESYFEVTCFEGLVGVTHNNTTVTLQPGRTFKLIDGKLLANEKENAVQPNWLHGESSFKTIALKHVLSEIENHYDIRIIADEIDTSRLFTGSFTHNNLDLALKSVTIPLNLSYSKSGKSILLKRE
ncbi:FecR family protein [Winogradskyella eckloniae]|uniref:FecR family protein n=1 Tax=Winogradskyella eckloniae TaxID=1089306 RepID=UPI001566A83A|nr:FecR family protein [Winogradskyella eckloniae]NRD21082.1 FecR family protein [Winogradskyella eckloniae]